MNHFRDLLFMTSGFSLLNGEILALAFCKHLTRGVKIERPSSEACKSSCGYGLFFPLWCTASSISLELTTLFQSSSLSAMYRLSLQWALQSHYGQSLLTYSIKSQTLGKKLEKSSVLLVKQLSRRAFPRVGKSTKAFQPVSSPRRLIFKRFMSPANTMTVLGCFSKMFSVK